jgi:hypothetical protein
MSFAAPLALFALALILWLPFGFDGGATGDAWIYFMQLQSGAIFSYANPLRLFIPLPWLIGYTLTPGTFVGVNVVTLLLLFGKSALLYALLRRLTAHPPLAFAAAALYLLLPADTGIFYLGALAIHCAVFCLLLAVYLLLVYWKSRRLIAWIVIWVAQLFAVGTYELVYPPILLTPALLLLQNRRLSRRWWITSAVWYVVPGLYALWYAAIALTYPRAAAYQAGLSQGEFSLGAVLTSLFAIYRRHFIDGWIEAGAFWWIALAAGVIAFTAVMLITPPARKVDLRAVIAGGLALILIGVAIYLPTSVRDETTRTYYVSGIGAGIAAAGLLWWIGGRRRWWFAALIGLLALIGTSRLLDQHQTYVEQSIQQQRAAAAIAAALPPFQPNMGIAVIDATSDLRLEAVINPMSLDFMLFPYHHDLSIRAILCASALIGTDAGCRFEDGQLTAPSFRTGTISIPAEALIVLRYDGAAFTQLPAFPAAP